MNYYKIVNLYISKSQELNIYTEQCDLLKHQERSGFKPYLNAFSEIKDDPRVAICNLSTNHRGWLSTFCDNVYL